MVHAPNVQLRQLHKRMYARSQHVQTTASSPTLEDVRHAQCTPLQTHIEEHVCNRLVVPQPSGLLQEHVKLVQQTLLLCKTLVLCRSVYQPKSELQQDARSVQP